MFMLCWFYCVPFAEFMYYALAPLTIMFSLYLLKRGICRGSLWQRKLAVFLIFLSILKISLLDFQEVVGSNIFYHILNFSCLIIGLVVCYFIHVKFGSRYIFRKKKPKNDTDLRVWANTSMLATILLICWELFPWLGYLLFGEAPEIFILINWRIIAAFNFITLLIGFWLSEEHYWYYNESVKGTRKGAAKIWVPSDTLWLCLPLYLIALMFGFIADDILK